MVQDFPENLNVCAILTGNVRKGSVREMKFIKTQMKELVKENKELQVRLKEMIKEHHLEKNLALKALYHAEVAEGGKYQLAYQALDKK